MLAAVAFAVRVRVLLHELRPRGVPGEVPALAGPGVAGEGDKVVRLVNSITVRRQVVVPVVPAGDALQILEGIIVDRVGDGQIGGHGIVDRQAVGRTVGPVVVIAIFAQRTERELDDVAGREGLGRVAEDSASVAARDLRHVDRDAVH